LEVNDKIDKFHLLILSLGLFVIMQYIVRDHIPFKDLPLITPHSDWPVFFASSMYVFEGIALVCILNKKKILK